MRQTSKKSVTKLFRTRARAGLLMVTGLLLVAGLAYPTASNVWAARSTCDSISECRDQISETEDIVADLKSQALSYQNAIAILNGQISQLQNKIDYNVAKQHKLENEIAAKQAEIKRQRVVLGDVLRSMYVDGQMSMIEKLASSKGLDEYVDKEEYSNSVQNKIQEALARIAKLEQQLKSEKAQVASLIKEEKSERAKLNSARQKQHDMLAYNQSQRSSYNAQTSANKAKLQKLIEAQRRANASPSPGGYYFINFPGSAERDPLNGSYDYAGYGYSRAPAGCGYPDPWTGQRDSTDRWGYCTRQCTSYAAWALEYSGQQAPYYYGDAKEWIYNAKNDGIPFHATPHPGDIAVSTAGTWGHVMYVEKVSGNMMFVSQYNQQYTGQFSTQWRAWR